ncbi:group I truncated hemoglobin [Chondrinema litorale]|uniref:group I truncated hemoglobin n=1 Tax=Chondrinema litorale TaxID=2994555 RepID=UPI002542F836|nr:group 1 truncated hemoglobin [Chondrinema litorale]UZR99515.1 group 1 truncated hemoglobin [Chondrinema litorale]
MEKETKSLFDRIGGMAAVNAAVDIFYKKVLADESISHFFTNTDMKKQIAKQKAFLAYAFGAPMAYTGKSLRAAHTPMSLTEAHFSAVATHLVGTLEELNVSQNLIDEVVEIALSTKNDVLNK